MSFTPSTKLAAEKLGIAPQTRLLVLGQPLPASVELGGSPVSSNADIVLIVCANADDVSNLVAAGLAQRNPDGRLWIAYRKGRSGFTRAELGATVDSLDLDLTWFRQISLDDAWSAIWFKRRSEFHKLRH